MITGIQSKDWLSEQQAAAYQKTNTLLQSLSQQSQDTAEDSTGLLDIVELSSQSLLMAQSQLVMPTLQNVSRLSDSTASALDKIFQDAGINCQPPIEIEMDEATGNLTVSGDRDDTQQIEDLLNGNAAFKEQFQTFSAVASHARAIVDGLQALNSSASTDELSQISAANYEFSLRIDGNKMNILFNGETWG